MAGQFQLTVVRTDGISHTSTFGGWDGEGVAYQRFNHYKEDKRTLFIAMYEDGELLNTFPILPKTEKVED